MRAIKNIRLRDYDYSTDGYYFVTVCTDYFKPYLVGNTKVVAAQFIGQTFGSRQDNCLINQATTNKGVVAPFMGQSKSLINLSRAQSRDQAATEQKYIPGVELDWYIIMPTHIHLILILKNCNLKLGEIVRRFKAKTSKEVGFKLWQPNYYEHIIRNEAALNRIREYIQNNPQAREIDFEKFYKKEHDKQEPDKPVPSAVEGSGSYKGGNL